MKHNILQTSQNVHCVGIKGTGLSALAGILAEQGKTITGSDASGPAHDAKNITQDIDLVIYSAAVAEYNIERTAARSMGIKQLSYPEALGLLTENHTTIAVCGTHGKTTTTSMLSIILKDVIDPTILVGAKIRELHDRNFRVGQGKYLIIEACEYQRHFLHYFPDIICLTNIELDHLDYFQDEDDYRDAFESFLLRLPPDGKVIANQDDTNVVKVCEAIKQQRPDIVFIFYSSGNSEFQEFDLTTPGEHNNYNAMAALKTAESAVKIDKSKAIKQLNNFTGAGRRFEQFKCSNGTVIVDDYAHHPTAISATLKAARKKFGPDATILCVFQPHQHSRTIKLLKAFKNSFEQANEVIIPNIYQTRDTEEDIKSITAESFVEELLEHHNNVQYGHGLQKTLYDVQNRHKEFDVIIFMGAGDIITISDQLKSSCG